MIDAAAATHPGTAEENREQPTLGDGPDPQSVRLLFRHLGGDEWDDYRAILAVFADTYFAEFSPEEVQARLAADGEGVSHLSVEVVRDRLDSLRGWGNLTVSTDAGNPTSLEDYNRRRHRYLMTPAGQQVHDLVERVLANVGEVSDPQAGRLSDLAESLRLLADHAPEGFRGLGIENATAAVRAVFDTHERFTEELIGFFRHLAQWQSRYDLTPDQVQVLAGVIVGYVSEQLAQIERLQRPVARHLRTILPCLDELLPLVDAGLAARVDEAGLADTLSARRVRGSDRDEWHFLDGWFSDAPGRPARLSQLTEQALAAVRTLTANLSRISRMGTAVTSRRADFLRLAAFFASSTTSRGAHETASAALGLGSCRTAGMLAADADDPAPTSTPWASAPPASVPVSLRERGERAQRGHATPVRDRSSEQRMIRERLEAERMERAAAARELLAVADSAGRVDGARMSNAAFGLLAEMIGQCSHQSVGPSGARAATAAGLRCELRRMESVDTSLSCPDGRLWLHGLTISVADLDDGQGDTDLPSSATVTTEPRTPEQTEAAA